MEENSLRNMFRQFKTDESDIEEVDSEVMEEEEALKALQAVQKAPAVPTVPTVQTVPAVPAVPVLQTIPAAPVVQMLPAVQIAPAVPVQTSTPSTAAVRTRKCSPPSRSLQDELNKAWTEFTHDKVSLPPGTKSTATNRKEGKPQLTQVKGVEKLKPVPKSILNPKPPASSAPQNKFGLKKEQPQKEGAPHQFYKPEVMQQPTKPFQGSVQLIKYVGSNVEVTQQKQLKGTMGNVVVTMVNSSKNANNPKIVQHNMGTVNLQQKTSLAGAESKADKQNGSSGTVTTRGTVVGSDSMLEVKRLTAEANEIRKLGPSMSAYKVGALGKSVEIYRIPGQRSKPVLSKVIVENESSASKTEDMPLKRTQTEERTAKIQDSNGHLVQTSKPESSQLCHIEIFKVQNHGDKPHLTTLVGTDAPLCPVAEVPCTKQVSVANKLQQNFQPTVKSNKIHNSGDGSGVTTGKLEQKHNKDQDDILIAGKFEQNLQPVHASGSTLDMQDDGSNVSKGTLEHNLAAVVTANIKDHAINDSASYTAELVLVSDPKIQVGDDATDRLEQNLHSGLSCNAKVQEEGNKCPPSEKTHSSELSSDAMMHENNHNGSTVIAVELEQNLQPVLTSDAQSVNTSSPSCRSTSLPSAALTSVFAEKVGGVEDLEPREPADVTKFNTEDDIQGKMELQEPEQCTVLAKTVEVEKGSDITRNIVEELLNGAAMFADSDSVEPELPLSLGESEGKAADETEHLGDILGSRDETELPQDISKLIEQSEDATDSEKIEDRKEIDKTPDAVNEHSKTEDSETVEDSFKLKKNGEECTQDTFGGGVMIQDTSEKLADCNQELDGVDDNRQCHICAKSFPLSVLQRHITSHWSQKDLLCEKCGISFFFPADLERHEMSHGSQDLASNKEDTPTMQQQQLKVSRQRTFTCGACGMDFTNWFQLRDHKLIHKKGRRHKCRSCSKHFRTKYLLQNHMWVHTMLKKPHCELCGKTFSLPWYVDRHIAEEHS